MGPTGQVELPGCPQEWWGAQVGAVWGLGPGGRCHRRTGLLLPASVLLKAVTKEQSPAGCARLAHDLPNLQVKETELKRGMSSPGVRRWPGWLGTPCADITDPWVSGFWEGGARGPLGGASEPPSQGPGEAQGHQRIAKFV